MKTTETSTASPKRMEEPTAPIETETKTGTPVLDPLAEMTELLQRTQANFENYRKQTEKRVQELQQMAAKDIILKILPLVDNFQLALQHAQHQEEFLKGVELIYSQLRTTLEEQGVQPILTEGREFDPRLHEPLLKVESELPKGKIIEEFQQGFTLHGVVIRHAKVKISAGSIEHNTKK